MTDVKMTSSWSNNYFMWGTENTEKYKRLVKCQHSSSNLNPA